MHITDEDVIDSIQLEAIREALRTPKAVLPEPQPDEELNFSPEPNLRRFS